MRTKVALALVAAVMLIAGTAAIGSNMGFKISIQLAPVNVGVHDGLNWVSLPFYNSYTNAASIKTDIGATCTELDRWDPASGTYQKYTGGPGSVNFTITPGEGYLIKVNAQTNWVVVGSHNPSLAYTLNPVSVGTNDGLNWVSIPYHTTATNASTLKTQIGVTCTELDRWDPASGSYQKYTGGPGSVNFSITPGEGILVKVNASTAWTPAHY